MLWRNYRAHEPHLGGGRILQASSTTAGTGEFPKSATEPVSHQEPHARDTHGLPGNAPAEPLPGPALGPEPPAASSPARAVCRRTSPRRPVSSGDPPGGRANLRPAPPAAPLSLTGRHTPPAIPHPPAWAALTPRQEREQRPRGLRAGEPPHAERRGSCQRRAKERRNRAAPGSGRRLLGCSHRAPEPGGSRHPRGGRGPGAAKLTGMAAARARATPGARHPPGGTTEQ